MGVSCGEVLGCVRVVRTVVADAAAVSNVVQKLANKNFVGVKI
jgi:hypothetical protein